jgi:hypothetical protein
MAEGAAAAAQMKLQGRYREHREFLARIVGPHDGGHVSRADADGLIAQVEKGLGGRGMAQGTNRRGVQRSRRGCHRAVER